MQPHTLVMSYTRNVPSLAPVYIHCRDDRGDKATADTELHRSGRENYSRDTLTGKLRRHSLLVYSGLAQVRRGCIRANQGHRLPSRQHRFKISAGDSARPGSGYCASAAPHLHTLGRRGGAGGGQRERTSVTSEREGHTGRDDRAGPHRVPTLEDLTRCLTKL